ncbi:hypothetical protein DFH06DRAFT_1209643 [Mycena polygramma]|nr:hypothetical protein DFH06DRAFT_1209643 [Mycena polygramma]
MLVSTSAQDFVLDDMTVDAQIDLRKFVLTRNSPLYMAIEPAPASVPVPDKDFELFPDWEYSTDAVPAASTSISPAASQKPARPALVVMSTPSRPRMQRTASILDIPSLSPTELPTGDQDLIDARASIDSDASSSSSRSRRSSVTSNSSSTSTDTTATSVSNHSESISCSSAPAKPRRRAIPRLCASVAKSISVVLKELFNPDITLTPEQAITIAPLPLMREKPYKASRKVPAAFLGLAPGEKRTRFLCPVPPPRYNSGDFLHIPDV